MAVAVTSTRVVRSPVSQESLVRRDDVLRLCKDGNVDELEKILVLNKALISHRDENGDGLSYYAAESCSLPMCKLVYEKDPILFSASNAAGQSAFRKALSMGDKGLINWFLETDPSLLIARDKHGDAPIVWACKRGLEDVVSLILARDSRLIFERDGETGSCPFLIACRLGLISLAQRIYRENSQVINFKDRFDETALLKAFKAQNGIEVVSWLLDGLEVSIVSEDEAEFFVKAIPRLDKKIVKKVLKKCDTTLFICHFPEIEAAVKDPRDRVRLDGLRRSLPMGFDFQGQGVAHLTGKALIEYYNVVIEDIPSIEDPCSRLMILFNGLTQGDYLANMNLGRQGELVTLAEATSRRERELALCHAFMIEAIGNEKPDKAIPLGETSFYYIHLKRIFRHLVKYLEELEDSKRKDEIFSYLSMITAVSGSCYTNYSTLCHNMYGALVNDTSFVEAASQYDQPSVKFFNKTLNFFERKIKGKALGFFQDRDAHVVSVIQRMFDEANVPYLGEVAPFDDVNLLPALLSIRRDLLGKVETDHDLGFFTDEDLYDNTKEGVVEKFKRNLNSITFIYRTLRECLLLNLNGADGSEFLEGLSEWLTENGILATDVLEYDGEHDSYSVIRRGLCRMLQRFPTQIVI